MDDLLEYERLVYSVINKYGGYVDKDDLYQVGMMGLIDAKSHFDERDGVKFSSYAYYYIVGEVTKFLRENRCMKVSRDIVRLGQDIDKTTEVMRQRLGREPTDMEVALFMEIDEAKIGEVRCLLQDEVSFDYDADGEVSLYNSVMSFDSETTPEVLDLNRELGCLSEEEKRLIMARYFQDMTQSEVSRELGMSQVQVSRKEGKILEKLRQRL